MFSLQLFLEGLTYLHAKFWGGVKYWSKSPSSGKAIGKGNVIDMPT